MSRATWVFSKETDHFQLRGYHPVSPAFPDRSFSNLFCNSLTGQGPGHAESHDPGCATLLGLAHNRFGLFPVRSPLLRESRLFSFPRGTEMVHFPRFAPHPLFYSGVGNTALPVLGFPIRKSPDRSLFATHRSFSQLTTSFIASRRQGIHRTLLVA